MRRFLVLFFLAFISPAVFAQIKFEVQSPLSVRQGERFQVVFVLYNGEGKDFAPPKFEGVKIAYGPAISSGSTMVQGTGIRTQQVSFQSYTYTLDAQSNTKIVVGAASIAASGKRYGTKPVKIEVNGSTGAAVNGSNSGPTNSVREASDMLVRMEVSPKTVYKGQAMLAQLKLYHRAQVQIIPEKFPVFNGFWAQELPLTNENTARANVNGKLYNSKIIAQWLLYPQKSGKLEIEQSSIATVAMVSQVIGVGMVGETMTVNRPIENKWTSPAVVVDVKNLPSGAPVDFSMAMGKFTLSSTISSRVLTANSSGTIKLTLKGTGNFPVIDAPKLIFPEGVDGYEPKMSENVTNTVDGTSGERSWEYPFVARSAGNFDIAAVNFSYFDPQTSRYNTLRSDSYTLTVTRDPNAGKGTIVTTFSGDEDIKPLRTAIPPAQSGTLWLYSFSFFGLIAAIVVIFTLLLWFLRRRMARRADVVGRKLKRASRVALSKLKKAKSFMVAGDRAAFFEEMLRAMWGFVGDKFNIDLAEMSKENIGVQFIDRGYDADIAERFLAIVDECEFARYAPASSGDMRLTYDGALALFSDL